MPLLPVLDTRIASGHFTVRTGNLAGVHGVYLLSISPGNEHLVRLTQFVVLLASRRRVDRSRDFPASSPVSLSLARYDISPVEIIERPLICPGWSMRFTSNLLDTPFRTGIVRSIEENPV